MCPQCICLFVVSLNDRLIMCPICLPNLALIAVGLVSMGGLAALAARMMLALSESKRCSKLSRSKRLHL
jgi:hypothetical protein